MQYRKKPVVIEAIRFLGFEAGGATFDGHADWLDQAIFARPGDTGAIWPHTLNDVMPERPLCVATLEGIMNAVSGDWIIRGIKGELYPCKPDIFEATYEAVVEGATIDAARGDGEDRVDSDIVGDIHAATGRASAFALDHTKPTVMVIFKDSKDAVGFASAVERILDRSHGVDTKLQSLVVTNLLGEEGVPADSAYQPTEDAMAQQFAKGLGDNAHLFGSVRDEDPGDGRDAKAAIDRGIAEFEYIPPASGEAATAYDAGFAAGYAKARPLDPGTIYVQPMVEVPIVRAADLAVGNEATLTNGEQG